MIGSKYRVIMWSARVSSRRKWALVRIPQDLKTKNSNRELLKGKQKYFCCWIETY